MGATLRTFHDHLTQAISEGENARFPSTEARDKVTYPSEPLAVWVRLRAPSQEILRGESGKKATFKRAYAKRPFRKAENLKDQHTNDAPKQEKTVQAKPAQTIATAAKDAGPFYSLSGITAEAAIIIYRWKSLGVLTLSKGDEFSAQQVKRAFRLLALQYHPDRYHDVKEAQDLFIQAQGEYSSLKKLLAA